MKFELITIGKNSFNYVDEGVSIFKERISNYVKFDIKHLPDIKNSASLSVEARKIKEGEIVLKEITTGDILVLLDEHGREFTSVDFASFLQKQMNTGAKCMKFLIGGPYGFSDAVYKRASFKISLSKLTFPHDMVRLVFVEQFYRALTIQKGEKYHHE